MNNFDKQIDLLKEETHIDIVNAVSRIKKLIDKGESYDNALKVVCDKMDATFKEIKEIEKLLDGYKGKK